MPGATQVKGCQEITRGYFAECINMDPMGDDEKLMMYIGDIGSFILDEPIPIWVKEGTKVNIYEPLVTAPISAISQMKSALTRAGHDQSRVVQTILAELPQCLENRCGKWNTKVGTAMTASTNSKQ